MHMPGLYILILLHKMVALALWSISESAAVPRSQSRRYIEMMEKKQKQNFNQHRNRILVRIHHKHTCERLSFLEVAEMNHFGAHISFIVAEMQNRA
jgi:hypothetical protein